MDSIVVECCDALFVSFVKHNSLNSLYKSVSRPFTCFPCRKRRMNVCQQDHVDTLHNDKLITAKLKAYLSFVRLKYKNNCDD